MSRDECKGFVPGATKRRILPNHPDVIEARRDRNGARMDGHPRALSTPLLGAVVGGLLLLLPGCPEYPSCRKDAHCRTELGEVCVDKTCQNCKTDDDCIDKTPEGQPAHRCVGFRCQPPGADAVAGGGEEGDPCVSASDCFGGLVCTSGACALCNADAECSPATCNFDTGRCAPDGQCQTDAMCAMDEICDGGMCVFEGNLGEEGGGPCGVAAVYFAFDSDAITPHAQELLDKLAGCLVEQNIPVVLEAHADNRGTEEYNIMLTERRGTAVQRYLVDHGVAPQSAQVIAKGSLEASGSTEPARAKERRVQFLWP
jgi:peptidoglycan-associated lipoprotein